MNSFEDILFLVLASIVILFFAGIVIKYFVDHVQDIRYVKGELDKAYGWDEFVYWKRELSALRWSIIPGLTPSRVKNICNVINKWMECKTGAKSDGFTSMLVPSVLGICLCAICLAGGTFAWFTSNEVAGVSAIQTANYVVDATILSQAGSTVVPQDDVYTMDAGTYTITLNVTGTATSGYTIVRIGKSEPYTDYYTSQLPVGSFVVFGLTLHEGTNVQVIPQWGTAANPQLLIDVTQGITYGTVPIVPEPILPEMVNPQAVMSEEMPIQEEQPVTEQTQPQEEITLPIETNTTPVETVVTPTETLEGGATTEDVASDSTSNWENIE